MWARRVEKKWQMRIDPDKFEVMTDTKDRKPIKYNYSLHGQTLKQEISVTYIGVDSDDHLHPSQPG